MSKILVACTTLYLLGFSLFFVVEVGSGPVTPALAFVRALVWPVYWTTGWPHGTRARMD